MSQSVTGLIRQWCEKLRLKQETEEEARATISTAGLPGDKLYEVLYKEWLNDLLADIRGKELKKAGRNPDEHFMSWLRWRVAHPYYVSYRYLDRATRFYGADNALRFVTIIWKQEIAWAKSLRKDENPRIAVVSALFLREAINDTGGVFSRLMELYVKRVAEDPEYPYRPEHDLDPDEIRFLKEHDSLWMPLYLDYGNERYGKRIKEMDRSIMRKLAEKAKGEEERELSATVQRKVAQRLREQPLCEVLTVIARARRLGLSSNDLVRAERAFIKEVEKGRVILKSHSGLPYKEFAEFLERPDIDVSSVASDEEEADLLQPVELLGKHWLDRLPEDFRHLGATKRQNFSLWKDLIIAGKRDLPANYVADYAFLLLDLAES